MCAIILLCRLETESKQLHQVIKQLRQAVRTPQKSPVGNDTQQQQLKDREHDKRIQDITKDYEGKLATAKDELTSTKCQLENEVNIMKLKLDEVESARVSESGAQQDTIEQLHSLQQQFDQLQLKSQQLSSQQPPANGIDSIANSSSQHDDELASLRVMVETYQYENKALAEKVSSSGKQIKTLQNSDQISQQDEKISQLEASISTVQQQLRVCESEKHTITERYSALQETNKNTGQTLSELKSQNQKYVRNIAVSSIILCDLFDSLWIGWKQKLVSYIKSLLS